MFSRKLVRVTSRLNDDTNRLHLCWSCNRTSNHRRRRRHLRGLKISLAVLDLPLALLRMLEKAAEEGDWGFYWRSCRKAGSGSGLRTGNSLTRMTHTTLDPDLDQVERGIEGRHHL
ncbi:hypothetical protein PHSY_005562 [Pseudozyma hubeiensis SY62]|uniref:Uncharacterized protein n=1 Tax=Pseudozyma hubeiensis (strain SY62) TaxID=1305764 RepID=R9P9E8_PSEHS|nr:hypothetical protein PHSY_005562 [Pseudozyma hubeiensis SY62]GAC97974.1 hypothetical protein PHSY_005562 [Pseudozyma hubeiensis SY62]